jgi:signal transduction histidine kinase
LVIEEPWHVVADPLLRMTEIAPLVLVPVVVIAVLGMWFGVRQIVQPLQALASKATGLAWGDFAGIEEPVGGIQEVRRLQAELIYMAQKVQLAQKSLRGYLAAVTAGQEEERRRLARELHDDTIQSLIALNQRVQLAQMALAQTLSTQSAPNGRPTTDQLAEVEEMTTQVIADLRRLTRNLRPIYLDDLGLVPALKMLAQDTGEMLQMPVEFHFSGAERRLEPQVELALYRVAQEALSNAARHAQASRIAVFLEFNPQVVVLTVSDDGCGFTVPKSPSEMAPGGHFGLLGMQERVELIGAQLEIHSMPGEGTRVNVTVPLSSDEL